MKYRYNFVFRDRRHDVEIKADHHFEHDKSIVLSVDNKTVGWVKKDELVYWLREEDTSVDEEDRNARAYGFEVGRGAKLATRIESLSEDNPFMDPNWRDMILAEAPSIDK